MYFCHMKSRTKKNNKNNKLEKEYNEIVNSSENSVVISTEWSKQGDYFNKLTLYDYNYISIPTLGETTLINTQ